MKGVSPVVATVLLVAIAVIASMSVWFWVSSYTAKPALVETTLGGYVVTGAYKNLSKDGCTGVSVQNTGGKVINNVALYLKDYLTGRTVGSNGTDSTYPAYVNLTSINPGASAFFSLSRLGGGVWIETNISEAGSLVMSVAIGDANNDSQNEVVIGRWFSSNPNNETRMYKNKTGGWVETNISDEPNAVFSVAIGDANNDGYKDVVIGIASTNNGTRMYENKTGKWVETNISNLPTDVVSVAIGDANNDGKNDVVIGMSPTTNEVRMYNYTGGSWVETNIYDPSASATVNYVAIGDANNDGLNEVVIGMTNELYEVRMYNYTGGSWVQTYISSDLGLGDVYSVAIRDADNDGQNEVVIGTTNLSGGNPLRMYKNTSGGWVETNISNAPGYVYSVAVGDVNHDGLNETVIGLGSTTNEVRMYKNISGTAVETNISDMPGRVYSVAIGDSNNNGLQDVVVGTGTSPNRVRMYEMIPVTTTVPVGTYILRTSSPGFADITFTCV